MASSIDGDGGVEGPRGFGFRVQVEGLGLGFRV